MFCTYAHYTPSGRIFYIGKGSEFRASTTKNRNANWHATVKNEGGFKHEILARWALEKDALDHERFLIETFRSMGHSIVNITSGGQGVSGLKHAEKTKLSLSQISLKNGSVERCKAMATDPIMIEKRRVSATGKKRTLESKQKMAKAKEHKSRPFEVCGKKFESISSLAKFLGMYHTSVRRWINDGQVQKLEGAYRAKISQH
jgi:hypothetical protein